MNNRSDPVVRADSVCLISEFLHGVKLRRMLVHQNRNFVFVKIALNTSHTAFVSTRQVCIAILAVILSVLEKHKTI